MGMYIERHQFHTRELIPWDVAKLGKETILNWKPLEKFWLKEGLEIAHRDNISQKMYVTSILRKDVNVNTGDRDKDGNFIYETIQKLSGVKCHWFQEEKQSKTNL
jgi:hypothetical protein